MPMQHPTLCNNNSFTWTLLCLRNGEKYMTKENTTPSFFSALQKWRHICLWKWREERNRFGSRDVFKVRFLATTLIFLKMLKTQKWQKFCHGALYLSFRMKALLMDGEKKGKKVSPPKKKKKPVIENKKSDQHWMFISHSCLTFFERENSINAYSQVLH